ncbi:MAG: tRNA (uridine(54)-C5)-methyltransferase TrmA [Helicobacteraceae bacterium]|jgi:tRNA (uracil-5-)-methyltransferase|nr:tRNA (uridine(54)-C5)-methyltransferase TrmA [Helicobacteraceae bacterium]
MNCEWFGECGGCALALEYDEQLAYKKEAFLELFDGFLPPKIEVFASKKSHFRNRGEFRVWHEADGGIALSMHNKKGGAIGVGRCAAMNERFSENMQAYADFISDYPALFERLFELDFLSSSDGEEMIITLIYHKAIDERWNAAAKLFSDRFGVGVIGRSKGKKLVIGRDYIREKITIDNRLLIYKQLEGAFSQPNGYINRAMIGFIDRITPSENDGFELYCGNGNFTLALSQKLNSAIAIEVNRNLLEAAKENAKENQRENIVFARMSAEEFAQAINETRSFKRLKEIDLNSFNFRLALVDPPRSGLDSASLGLIADMERIIYISCNPQTLRRDLETLTKTRRVVSAALFDQFPYTPHIESCIILEGKR